MSLELLRINAGCCQRTGERASAEGKLRRGELIGIVLGRCLVLGGRIRVQRQWTAHRSSGQGQPEPLSEAGGSAHKPAKHPAERRSAKLQCVRTAAMVADEVEGTTQYSWFTVPSLR